MIETEDFSNYRWIDYYGKVYFYELESLTNSYEIPVKGSVYEYAGTLSGFIDLSNYVPSLIEQFYRYDIEELDYDISHIQAMVEKLPLP